MKRVFALIWCFLPPWDKVQLIVKRAKSVFEVEVTFAEIL